MAKNNIEIKLLTKKDVSELSQGREIIGPVFSFYLGVKAGRNFVAEANSVITNAVKKIEASNVYSKNEKRKILKTTEKMKEKIRFLKLPDKTRSIVMFCDAGRKIGIYHIPVYIPSNFVIENDFYIHPLVKALEKHPRYLVVFLERDKTRFFSMCLGEIEEVSEITRDDVPQRINAARADWKGLSETRVQGHIQDHEKRHLKKAAEKTRDYFRYKKNGFSYLVIGARREFAEKFAKILDIKPKEKLIGSYYIAQGYDLNRIKAKSAEVISEHEKKDEEEIINNLFGGSSKEKAAAVLGINLILENFYLHNIDTLILGKNYKEAGYVCSKCHRISSYLKFCPKCGSKAEKAGDVADEIMEEAIMKKIKIKHLLYPHKEFDKFGIGAFLKKKI